LRKAEAAASRVACLAVRRASAAIARFFTVSLLLCRQWPMTRRSGGSISLRCAPSAVIHA